MSEYLNKTQLSKEMGVSIPTVNSWLRRGLPFIKEGSQDNEEWEFDLETCQTWYRNYKKINSGENIHNIFKVFSSLITHEFFSYITEHLGEADVLDFIGKKNKLSKAQMEKVFFDVYHMLGHYFDKWQKDNMTDHICAKELGFSVDELFNVFCPKLKISGESCNNYSHKLRIPSLIEKMHKNFKTEVKK
jgi:hypothetical protein